MSEPVGGSNATERRWRLGPRAAAALVVGVAFVVGGLAGAALFREFGRGEHEGGPRFVPGMTLTRPPVEEAEEGGEPGRASERNLARFARALDLTAAQAAAVDSIARHEFNAVSVVRDETWPRMQAVLDDTRKSIDNILTAAQRTKYHDMLARRQARWDDEQGDRDSAARAAKKP
ncbi:MAG: hypothetical protein ACREN6_15165 [Gemmatimonadaceae bacterium]